MNLISSTRVPLHGVINSMQGGRKENQDDCGFVETPLGFLVVVCDGMGGGPGGKTASYLVKMTIADVLSQCAPQMPREQAMRVAIGKANQVLEERAMQDSALTGMGSTVVSLLFSEQSVVVAHAGDSRCYRMRGSKVLFRTNDHSLVAELVRNKALTEEQARVSPQSNVITRGLGGTSNHTPDITEIPYRIGDRFILCTDGVWGMMSHSELLKRFSAKGSVQNLVSNLGMEIDNLGISNGGGHDNHTIAVIDMDSSSIMKDSAWSICRIPNVNLKDLFSNKMIFFNPKILGSILGGVFISLFAVFGVIRLIDSLKDDTNSGEYNSLYGSNSSNQSGYYHDGKPTTLSGICPNDNMSDSITDKKENIQEKSVEENVQKDSSNLSCEQYKLALNWINQVCNDLNRAAQFKVKIESEESKDIKPSQDKFYKLRDGVKNKVNKLRDLNIQSEAVLIDSLYGMIEYEKNWWVKAKVTNHPHRGKVVFAVPMSTDNISHMQQISERIGNNIRECENSTVE